MDTYDFKLTTPRDVAVYVSTLFTLTRRANDSDKLEAVLFLAEQLRGMVPDSALTAFLRELRQDRRPAAERPPEPQASPVVELPPTPAPTAPKPTPVRPAAAPRPSLTW